MLFLSPAIASAKPPTIGTIPAEQAAKQAETGDDFATLLGIQVAGAADEAKTGPAAVYPALPMSGKPLPDTADTVPEAAAAVASEKVFTDDPDLLPPPEMLAPPELLAVLIGLAAPVVPAAKPLAPQVSIRQPPPPVEPEGPAPTRQTQAQLPAVVATPASESPAKSTDDTAAKPAGERPDARPPFALPAQAAARAVLVHDAHPAKADHPTKPAPLLPGQAAAQATFALAVRGNPLRPGRLSEAAAAMALPGEAGTLSALPLTPLRPLKDVFSARAFPTDVQSPLGANPAADQPQSAPQTAVQGQSAAAAAGAAAAPAPARHDFAAMIDRLFEARDMAGAQPVAMTLRHDDFGAVSLNFRSSDNGLTVTMASADPDFARAVNVAGAPASASSQSDLSRQQGGEPAPSRQHGTGASSEDAAGQSRAGSRGDERDRSRQQRGQPSPQSGAPRRQDSSGIFA